MENKYMPSDYRPSFISANNVPRGYLAGYRDHLRWLMDADQWTQPVEMPSREVLQRVALADVESFVEDEIADYRRDLAAEAEAVLGYAVLRRELKMTSPLRKVLTALEIEPFSAQSVEQYKSQMEAYATQQAQKKNPSAYAYWQIIPISGYPRPVPEMALEKALQIKRQLPTAEFHIEELTTHPDPFLVVSCAGERYWIEVWDEPKFRP